MISFRIDWFDILSVQQILKSLLQNHNLKTSILWRSVFFRVQLSHLYMTTGKTIALTLQTFVSKVMSLLFNTLSRFGGSDSKESASNEGDTPQVAKWWRICQPMQETSVRFRGWEYHLGNWNGNPFQYSCLENSMDRGAWQATVHGVTKSQTQLSD